MGFESKSILILSISFLLLNGFVQCLAENEHPWPMSSHDPQHTSMSPYDSNLTKARLSWSFKTDGEIGSKPVIGRDGIIYVSEREGDLYAIHPSSRLEWRANLSDEDIWSEPAIDSDYNIYVTLENDTLASLNRDGSIRWKKSDLLDCLAAPTIGPDDSIYITGCRGQEVTIFNPDGTLKAKYKTNWTLGSSVTLDEDGTMFIGGLHGYLIAMNPDGSIKWSTNASDGYIDEMALSKENVLYLECKTEMDFGQYAHYICAYNATTGIRKWKTEFTTWTYAPAIAEDGTLYVVSVVNWDYFFTALDSNGTVKWTSPIEGYQWEPPTVSKDGTIYIGTSKAFYAFDPDGSERWNFSKDGQSFVGATISADGVIYLTAKVGYLYALGPTVLSCPRIRSVDVKDGQVFLDWDPPEDNGGSDIINYTVFRKNSTQPITAVGTTSTSITSFTDKNLINGESYEYQVVASNGVTSSDFSNPIQAIPCGLPGVPWGLEANATGTGVSLRWNPPSDTGGLPIQSYNVYKRSEMESQTAIIFKGDWSSFNDTNVTKGIEYYYSITCVNQVGESQHSNEVRAIPISLPSPPTNLTVNISSNHVELHWNPPIDDGGLDISGYRLYRETNGTCGNLTNVFAEIGPNGMPYIDNDVEEKKTYTYCITAFSLFGEGESSAPVSAKINRDDQDDKDKKPGYGELPAFDAVYLILSVVIIAIGSRKRR